MSEASQGKVAAHRVHSSLNATTHLNQGTEIKGERYRNLAPCHYIRRKARAQ